MCCICEFMIACCQRTCSFIIWMLNFSMSAAVSPSRFKFKIKLPKWGMFTVENFKILYKYGRKKWMPVPISYQFHFLLVTTVNHIYCALFWGYSCLSCIFSVTKMYLESLQDKIFFEKQKALLPITHAHIWFVNPLWLKGFCWFSFFLSYFPLGGNGYYL